jgi:Nucleotidyl transferase AbiEii toxin, Type IV TA system
MKPRLDVLPSQQAKLWPELSQVPEHFVLYGGTAIALRLGGRQSIDFDCFTDRPLSADSLIRSLPFLSNAGLVQAEANTATFSVNRDGEVNVSFFGSLSFGRIGLPERCEDNGLWIASLLDLAAQKMKVILMRAEAKDYLDIFALLQAGITLPKALGAAAALYPEFNPMISLKALTYYGEPTLARVPAAVREALVRESAKVKSVQPVKKLASTIGISP